ncbi:MAG: HlyD family type I secretion periplasmic adaptor subunit [Bauldia sp.]
MPAPSRDPQSVIRRLNIVGFATVAVLIGGIGGWAATSELAGAVIAPGSIVVESSVKKVQHPTGGTIGKLLVEEGSAVTAGDVLVRLDDTLPRTTLGSIRSALDTQLVREARLAAERDGAVSMTLPPELTPRKDEPGVAGAFAGERNLFAARHNTLTGQRAQLREQITQLSEQIEGLEAQIAAKDSELALIEKELVSISDLYDKRLVAVSQVTTLQRSRAGLQGERGALIAAVATARGKTSEIELQILQLDKDLQTSVLNDLRETEARIAELRERQTAAEDQLRRIDIRAPQSGIVHGLSVHTVGGVIGPGETIMEIVPRADELVVDAKIAPEDVDQISVGGPVEVRIMSGNRRTTPTVTGSVVRVAPDLLRETQTERPYFLVRIAFRPDASKDLGDLKLLPGMPVEAYFATQERTPLAYLLKPLGEQIARTFRER